MSIGWGISMTTAFDNETDDLTLFTQGITPSGRRSCMIALTDRETRLHLVDHFERLGYDVWTARSGLDAYRTCLVYHASMEVLVCDEHLPDFPPLVLFHRLKSQLPGLQGCVVASVTQREDEYDWQSDSVVLDVAGWRSGMLFVNASVPAHLREKNRMK